MGIIKRLSDVFGANANAITTEIEVKNTDKILDHGVVKSKTEYAQAVKNLKVVKAQMKKEKAEMDEAKVKADEALAEAKAWKAKGDLAKAQICMDEYNKLSANLVKETKEYETVFENYTRLATGVDNLKGKIENVEQKVATAKTDMAINETAKSVAGAGSSINLEDPTSTISRMIDISTDKRYETEALLDEGEDVDLMSDYEKLKLEGVSSTSLTLEDL